VSENIQQKIKKDLFYNFNLDEIHNGTNLANNLATYIIQNQKELLEKYTQFLIDCGYCDADVYCEDQKAVDRFIAESNA
jgi:hypothetical protein